MRDFRALMIEIEASNLGTRLSPISSLSIYEQAVRETDLYKELIAALRRFPDFAEDVESRISDLLKSTVSAFTLERSPYDFATALYLLALDDIAKDCSLSIASSVAEEPRLWWSHQIARSIAANAFHRSVTVIGMTSLPENILDTEHPAAIAESISAAFNAAMEDTIVALLQGNSTSLVAAKSVYIMQQPESVSADLTFDLPETLL
jgi:hypothetical protein